MRVSRRIRKYARKISDSGIRAYLVIRPSVRSRLSPLRNPRGQERNRRGRWGARWGGGRGRGGGGLGETRGETEERLCEMRDVRRDGLIEALLIAFTPPRGLPYLRMYPWCSSTFVERICAVAGIWQTPLRSSFLSTVVLRRPFSSSPPPRASAVLVLTFLLPHHRSASSCLSFALAGTLYSHSLFAISSSLSFGLLYVYVHARIILYTYLQMYMLIRIRAHMYFVSFSRSVSPSPALC